MNRKTRHTAVYLEAISKKRKAEFLALVESNRRFHKQWVAAPLTEALFTRYLARAKDEAFRGFFVCRTEDKALIGVINISQIIRGLFQSAFLGYYAFQPFTGNGYMSQGMSLVFKEAFTVLNLHRLEANIQPRNSASKNLVEKLGFRMEGFSPKYLQVDGKWRDHERWAITKEDWAKKSSKPRSNRAR